MQAAEPRPDATSSSKVVAASTTHEHLHRSHGSPQKPTYQDIASLAIVHSEQEQFARKAEAIIAKRQEALRFQQEADEDTLYLMSIALALNSMLASHNAELSAGVMLINANVQQYTAPLKHVQQTLMVSCKQFPACDTADD